MTREDREALWMIRERNGNAEIMQILDDFREIQMKAEENGTDVENATYDYITKGVK